MLLHLYSHSSCTFFLGHVSISLISYLLRMQTAASNLYKIKLDKNEPLKRYSFEISSGNSYNRKACIFRGHVSISLISYLLEFK